MNLDVVQNVLCLIRNIGKAYKKASPELKRQYLNLFWEQFRVQDKKIVIAQKTPIVIALESLGSIRFKVNQKPADKQVFDIDVPNNKVILSTVRGHVVDDVRNAFIKMDRYVYIPDLKDVNK